MIGTNRDLLQVELLLDGEIRRLKRLAADRAAPNWVHRRLALMCRQRISVCATLVNRRIEAARPVVDVSRWVSGNGALIGLCEQPPRDHAVAEQGWRQPV